MVTGRGKGAGVVRAPGRRRVVDFASEPRRQRGAVMGVCRNPLRGLHSRDMRPAPLGVQLQQLAPRARGALVLRVNGQWLLREAWASRVRRGDVIEWYDLPHDRDTLRTLATLAAVYFLGPQGLGLEGFALAAASTAASIAINALLPPQLPTLAQGPGETGTNFSTSLTGNTSRLDQPIWKVCGYDIITPPFAGEPYLEFLPRDDAEDPDLDRDQYFYALYTVGIGAHEVYAKIGNTPITRFDDVEIAQYLPPGTAPSRVKANVTTAKEVSSATMESGRYVGGFSACAPGRKVRAIGIDIAATKGLGRSNGDDLSVEWRVEYRRIDDYDQPTAAWVNLAEEERTGFTATPQRWTDTYTISPAGRIEVRVVRLDTENTSPGALHEIAWIGLRGFLNESAPLNPNAAHYEVVLRASSQLSQQATRDLRLIVKAKVRRRGTGAWLSSAFTRNAIDWLLELATSTVWGLGLPEDRIDFDSFEAIRATCVTRQDRFDYTFTQLTDAWSAMQLIARTCRSRVFRRYGLLTIARDELADAPVSMFFPGNCQPGSIVITEKLPRTDSFNGVIVRYRDRRSMEWTTITCPPPGRTRAQVTRPVVIELPGVIGAKQAEREGLYEAAQLVLRRRDCTWTTDLMGMLPTFLSPVAVQPEVVGVGTSGEVLRVDASTDQLTLSEPPDWSKAPLYLRLLNDDGTPTDALRVSEGVGPNDVIVDDGLPFTPDVDDGLRDPPRFILGPLSAELSVKVKALSDGGLNAKGLQLWEFEAVVDDDRVHTADLALLPAPGVTQDPITFPSPIDPDNDDDGEDPEVVVVPSLSSRNISGTLLSSVVGSGTATFGLNNDGSAEAGTSGYSLFTGIDTIGGEWLRYNPHDTTITGLYQVRATLLPYFVNVADEFGGITQDDQAVPPDTGTLDTWQSLATTRTWTLTRSTSDQAQATCPLKIEIRLASSGQVVLSKKITLQLLYADASGA